MIKKRLNWAYIAGFFDGEGHVRCDLRAKYLCPQIQVSQAEPQHEILFDMQSFLSSKGIVSKIHVREAKGNQARCFRLVISNQQGCFDFLNAVLPYLRVKRKQALVARRRIEERLAIRSEPGWRSKFTQEDAQAMAGLWQDGYSQQEIGDRFGTSQVHAGRLIRSVLEEG